MTNEEDQTAGKTHMSWSWLRMALNLREKIKLGDKQVIFIWAALVGALGALTALLFEMGVELVQDLLTGRHGYRQIQAFQEMASQDWAWCVFVPAAGGLLAGLTLLFTQRFVPAKATEYMEAVALGNGYVPPKPSLLRSLSAVFSIGSGASIGREGPLVQAAAVAGSALGCLASLLASVWLLVLKKSRQYLNGKRHWLPVRLMAAGMLVGVIAIFYPEIVGNGKNIITALIHYEFDTTKAAILLALKICTVAIVFGVGTVGGALTPSLTIGSVFGFLFSAALTQMGVPGEHAIAYSLVGMAAFFTTAANAPITSLVLVVEFTMAGQMMFPLIIGVLVSYGTARLTKAQSMYHDSLAFGPRSTFDKPLAQVQLQDVARKDPPVVHPLDKFGTIAAMLIKNPAQPIFVTSPAGKYLGSVEAEDVAAFARNKELAQAVLAMDVLRNDMPTLPADMHLPEALGIFSRPHCGESLALVNPDNDHLLGVVNKTDLYLVLSEIMRREKLQ